jgi:hypothetical protein
VTFKGFSQSSMSFQAEFNDVAAVKLIFRLRLVNGRLIQEHAFKSGLLKKWRRLYMERLLKTRKIQSSWKWITWFLNSAFKHSGIVESSSSIKMNVMKSNCSENLLSVICLIAWCTSRIHMRVSEQKWWIFYKRKSLLSHRSVQTVMIYTRTIHNTN